MMTLNRRSLLSGGAATAFVLVAGCGSGEARAQGRRVNLSEAQWRERLSAAEFRVLRNSATERPFTSPLNDENRRGTFVCAGCDNRLFSSETKFDSGTGWPSFYRPLSGAVGTETDRSLGMTRTEVHCADCGGHLGHVFNDGPPPTGKRYCINGVAMNFRAA